MSPEVGESAELLLLNAALARRLAPTAAAQLGWQPTWQPNVVCRKLLDLAETGAVLNNSHHVAVRPSSYPGRTPWSWTDRRALDVATPFPRDRKKFALCGAQLGQREGSIFS